MKNLFALTFVALTFTLATVSCGGSKSESTIDTTAVLPAAVDTIAADTAAVPADTAVTELRHADQDAL
jgi:hypothetical protein